MYLSILSHAGNIASALNIILAAKKITKNRLIWFIAALLSAFGGNFACNLLLLGTRHATLNIPCEIKLAFVSVIMVAVIFAHGTETAKPNCNTAVKIMELLNELAFITEYLGVLTSAAIGYQSAIQMKNSLFVAVMCGWTTAVSGNIFAKIAISTQAGKTFTSKLGWLRSELRHDIRNYTLSLMIMATYGLATAVIGKIVATVIFATLIKCIIDTGRYCDF